jgi:hypothetical protein
MVFPDLILLQMGLIPTLAGNDGIIFSKQALDNPEASMTEKSNKNRKTEDCFYNKKSSIQSFKL